MDNNILSKIIADYPNVWKDSKRFKAILADYLPEDKRLRNLILISVQERIPDDILQSKGIDSLQENTYVKRIVNAVGCNNEDALTVVELWTSAIYESEIDKRKMDRIKVRFMKLLVQKKMLRLSAQECADKLHRIIEKELLDN